MTISALSGCVTTLAPIRALPLSAEAHAQEVAVALQPNGAKHYVWTECTTVDETTCQLVYYHTLLGGQLFKHIFSVDAGTIIRYPDVAVTDDGTAYIVYSECEDSLCRDYYAVIPASDSGTVESLPLASPANISVGPPVVEARGDVVYALYLVPSGSNARLRYIQLSGGTSGGEVDFRAFADNSAVRFVITSGGKFHAIWKSQTDTRSEINYSNNLDTTGDIDWHNSIRFTGVDKFRKPDIALDAADEPYVVYAYYDESLGSEVVEARCFAASHLDCFNQERGYPVPLAAADNPWLLRGNPHIEIVSGDPTVVFSADNNATSTAEIWYYQPPSGSNDPGLTRVTDNSVHDGEPLIVKERSDLGDIPVVAWRTYTDGIISCPRDVYSFYLQPSSLQRHAVGNGGCFRNDRDMVASGPWVAGVWIDQRSDSDTQYVPWTLFNARTSYMPRIDR